MLWVKDAPKIDNDPDDVVCTFIDKYITAVIPPVAPGNEHHINPLGQPTETYTFWLLLHKQILPFWFSKTTCNKNTLISWPPLDDHDKILENAKSLLQTVQNTLTTTNVDNKSTQHFLQEINLRCWDIYECVEVFTKRAKCHFVMKPTRCFYKCMQSRHFVFMGRKCWPPMCNSWNCNNKICLQLYDKRWKGNGCETLKRVAKSAEMMQSEHKWIKLKKNSLASEYWGQQNQQCEHCQCG